MATDEQRQGIGNIFRRPNPDFEPAVGHVWVDDRPGLLIARQRDPEQLLVIWIAGPDDVRQEWVPVQRVAQLDF